MQAVPLLVSTYVRDYLWCSGKLQLDKFVFKNPNLPYSAQNTPPPHEKIKLSDLRDFEFTCPEYPLVCGD